ncbi:MAG: ATP F0F1 synthase subunit B [Alphaproteobacteria bacterium]|nr:MAG: ATP F0F1 synthase subunit B [Alphaproteobacteria bacterium]
MFGAEFWVAVFFFVLMGVFAWLGVFKWLGQTLDKRAARIRGELDEARSLKEEAQAALAQLQRRQREAAREAGEILEHAREEAALMQREMAANVEALIERRTQLAEDRIAQAEVAAAKHVRATAVDVATRAAARAIAAHLPASKHGELTDIAIDELDRKLH